VRSLLTGVVAAALLASSTAAAHTSAAPAEPYVELCGPSGCARTTDPPAVAQFRAFVAPITEAGQAPGFPPPVQGYYKVRAGSLRFPAVYLRQAHRLGIVLPGSPKPVWIDLGAYTVAALTKASKTLRPYATPSPSRVLVNNRRVRVRPIYRRLYDELPEIPTVRPSSKPWIGVAVQWPRSAPWPDMAFNLRRGTRVLLRPDHAVTVPKALAARIVADAPRKP